MSILSLPDGSGVGGQVRIWGLFNIHLNTERQAKAPLIFPVVATLELHRTSVRLPHPAPNYHPQKKPAELFVKVSASTSPECSGINKAISSCQV